MDERDVRSLCNSLYWFLLLVLVSIWLAFLCFPFYVLSGILSTCVPKLRPVTEILLDGVRFPEICCQNMVNAHSPRSNYTARASYYSL